MIVGQEIEIFERIVEAQNMPHVPQQFSLVELFRRDFDLESVVCFINGRCHGFPCRTGEDVFQTPILIIQTEWQKLAPAVAVDGMTEAEISRSCEKQFGPHV